MDLTFQFPMQYSSLLSSPATSATGHRFLFGSASSFFLELVLHSSPLAYWIPLNQWGRVVHLLVSYLFAFSYCSWGSQGKNADVVFPIPFSSGPSLSKLFTMTHLSWVALHSVAHSFTELGKVVVHMISLVNFL